MLYEALAQFAKANAPSFRTPGFEAYLGEARDYFNMRSRVATNPKEITQLSVIDDRTIRIIFRSQEVLNVTQISRSLRVFSMFLIDETHPLNFSNFVSGKRLFRMTASELTVDPENKSDCSDDVVTTQQMAVDSSLLLFKDIIKIMECSNADNEASKAIAKIDDTVKEYFRNRRINYANK